MSKSSIENTVTYLYILSVVLSPLGPIVHYLLWVVCLLLLGYNSFANGVSMKVATDRNSKAVLISLSLIAVWTALAGTLSFYEFDGWGRNLSFFIELLLGIYLAMRTLNTSARRDTFMKYLVVASALIMVGNIARSFGIIDFPNHSMQNGNGLSLYGLMMFVPFLCFQFGTGSHQYFRPLLLLLSICVLIVAFSTGGWGAALVSLIMCLVLGVSFGDVKWPRLFVILVAAVAFFCAGNSWTDGALLKRAESEISQFFCLEKGDLRHFTNGRNIIWKKTIQRISERPLTGWGGMRYRDAYCLEELHKRGVKHLPQQFWAYHPHNTYLFVAYLSGIPGLILFLYAGMLMFLRAWRIFRTEKDCFMPWGLTGIILLTAVASYGLTSDVFQGRRDVSVICWCLVGILLAMKQPSVSPKKDCSDDSL